MATYRMTLLVGSGSLATLLSLIEGSKDIKLASVTDFADAPPLPPSPPPPSRVPQILTQEKNTTASGFVGGRRNKGVSGEQLILETLRSGPANLDELRHVFANRGFAAASASPYVSKMLRAGSIQRGMHGRLFLKPDATNGPCR
jgi:hypothetical protein